MRAPSDEARRIVDELGQQMQTMPDELQSLPRAFFRVLCDAEDISQTASEVERSIADKPEFAGRHDYVLAVFRACVHAAASTRLSVERAWPAVMEAQRHAGVALALFISSAEATERKKALARHAKEMQTKTNDRLRLHVLQAAARSSLGTPSGAAANIVRKLEAEHGALTVAVQAFDADLTPEPAPLARVFAAYITKDMERLGLRGFGKKVPQPLNRELFSRWKKLHVSPAND